MNKIKGEVHPNKESGPLSFFIVLQMNMDVYERK